MKRRKFIKRLKKKNQNKWKCCHHQSLKQIKKVFAEPASKDDIDPLETNEWIESLNSVIENDGAIKSELFIK